MSNKRSNIILPVLKTELFINTSCSWTAVCSSVSLYGVSGKFEVHGVSGQVMVDSASGLLEVAAVSMLPTKATKYVE